MMNNYELRITNFKEKQTKKLLVSLFFMLCSLFSFSQVASSIDSTSIKIGQQITYEILVEADTTDLVVFPEGQTFLPLEMIESYKTDTTKLDAKYTLIKKYGLTQFDSGAYTIPRQKIVVGTKTLFTDSLNVEVNMIVVDTIKQGLYDIKPIIDVKKSVSKWWLYVLLTLLIIAAVAFLLYWFIWRKKPLTEEEEIALLPPYDRAKLALKKLDEADYLQHSELKEYYSELTFIIRKYLDEKVYSHALESTTDELIDRLNLLKDGNQIDLSKEDIKNIENILKRADLVKFAKSEPDVVLAEIDRNTIDLEIDHVKEALPEPTEDEKLLNQQYKEEQERKTKRKKIILTVAIGVFLLIATLVGFGIKYGFSYVKDTIVGHESKELLEGNWVTSEYGVPPVTISTPVVLKRLELSLPDEIKDKVKVTTFGYGALLDAFSIGVSTMTFQNQPPQQGQEKSQKVKIDLNNTSERRIKKMEAQGAKDITVKREQFLTPNAAEGIKTFGTMSIPILNTENYTESNYVMLHFTAENVLQQIEITWAKDDVYADDMVKRMLDSVELKKLE